METTKDTIRQVLLDCKMNPDRSRSSRSLKRLVSLMNLRIVDGMLIGHFLCGHIA